MKSPSAEPPRRSSFLKTASILYRYEEGGVLVYDCDARYPDHQEVTYELRKRTLKATDKKEIEHADEYGNL